MRVLYTRQSIESLEESLLFLIEEQGLSLEKTTSIKKRLFNKADSLAKNPTKGQKERYLNHLDEEHRRLVDGYFKIIYKIVGQTIYIIDFFDSRQNPKKMKG